MAFGKNNDCVRLALGDYKTIESLDLSLLTELKKSDKGVEIKLLDRTKILAQLADLSDRNGENQTAQTLLEVLRQEDDDT